MNNKGTGWSEVIFIIVMLGGLLVPAALFGQWYLFAAFAIFGMIFGLLEWYAKKKSGKTVSQHFWAFSLLHPVKAWVTIGCMLIAWLGLLVHLASKMIASWPD
jgi:hypothetical protein